MIRVYKGRVDDGLDAVQGAVGYRTDLCRALHSQDLDTLDDRSARVVDAVKHRLGRH